METRHTYFHRKRHKPGTAPGTLTNGGDISPPGMQLIAYGPDNVTEANLNVADEIRQYIGQSPVTWINIDSVENAETIRVIGEIFNLHPLALEDTINVHQRAKTEDYGQSLYTVCRMANSTDGEIDLEQISIFAGKGYVVSFQEAPGDCWAPVRERIRKRQSRRLMSSGQDYLLYTLLDSVIDDYFPLLEKFGDRLDDLEERLLDSPDKSIMLEIHDAKRALHTIRHAIWPMRESIGQIMAHEDIVTPETRVFLRDCQDHVIQVLDILENYRERVSGLMDIYLSSISNRMNEVMRVLTVISTIFMPLTFIVGIYGMNFDTSASPYNMPELENPYGYPAVMAVMFFIAAVMIVFFAREGWFGLGKDKSKSAADKNQT